ncbi:hypothetical protein [Coleofasciculus sp. FACHB-SPT9]|uniref:hypothetical protein n=1 Tax=Cyanophyceae TaxID=3028117 RepID=UPI00168705C0|nr:hypothetical protein [Coleofasciculus sp. FACHB-SPT9]MBD1892912.1 hypothetical protein [Coleofasciculus sp. FACHB-SPT9]
MFVIKNTGHDSAEFRVKSNMTRLGDRNFAHPSKRDNKSLLDTALAVPSKPLKNQRLECSIQHWKSA